LQITISFLLSSFQNYWERGYRVFKAFDGIDALNRLKQIAMNLLFVDIYMPPNDGAAEWQRSE